VGECVCFCISLYLSVSCDMHSVIYILIHPCIHTHTHTCALQLMEDNKVLEGQVTTMELLMKDLEKRKRVVMKKLQARESKWRGQHEALMKKNKALSRQVVNGKEGTTARKRSKHLAGENESLREEVEYLKSSQTEYEDKITELLQLQKKHEPKFLQQIEKVRQHAFDQGRSSVGNSEWIVKKLKQETAEQGFLLEKNDATRQRLASQLKSITSSLTHTRRRIDILEEENVDQAKEIHGLKERLRVARAGPHGNNDEEDQDSTLQLSSTLRLGRSSHSHPQREGGLIDVSDEEEEGSSVGVCFMDEGMLNQSGGDVMSPRLQCRRCLPHACTCSHFKTFFSSGSARKTRGSRPSSAKPSRVRKSTAVGGRAQRFSDSQRNFVDVWGKDATLISRR
jgi:hypothetical protein